MNQPACNLRPRKRGYLSKSEAKRAARLTETSGRGDKVGRIVTYRCRGAAPCDPSCRLWHNGHPKGSYRERVQ